MEKLVHLLEIFKTILHLNFLELRNGLLGGIQSLKPFESFDFKRI
jgi:hypothetical protein